MKSRIHHMAFTIIIGIFSLNMATASIVTDGLVSYWTFDRIHVIDETVKDVWGENNGEIKGNPKVVPGQVGEALEFDGAGDFVNLTTLGDFGSQLGNSSFEAWIKTTNKTDWMTLINTHGGECPHWGIEFNGVKRWGKLEMNEGVLYRYISFSRLRGCGTVGGGGSVNIFDGEWHHIVSINDFVVDGGAKGSRVIFIDGVSSIMSNSAFGGDGAFLTFTVPAYLGARNFQGKTEGFFEGMIDEVRFYDRPLTLKEIRRNFESTTPYNVEPKGKLSTLWGSIKDTK